MQQLMNEARSENVTRRVLPLTSQRLLLELGFPVNARLLVNGIPCGEVEIDWIDPVSGSPAIASGVARNDPLHKRKMMTCVVPVCQNREINGQGPFVSHIRWHEDRGDEVPEEMYETAGIAPKDRPRKRRR